MPANVFWPGIGKPSNPRLCSMTGCTTFHCIVLGSGRYIFYTCSALLSLLFLESVMYENSEEMETGTYVESGACDDLDFAEVEYDYGEVDVQGYEE